MIPRELREKRGLTPGVSVSFEERDEGVLVRPADEARPLKGRYARSGMADRLLEDRAREPR